MSKAFFAYASRPPEVGQAITSAQQTLRSAGRSLSIHRWEENDVSGRPLTDPIFDHIRESDFVIADITTLNFNVTFEVGYAIGLQKRLYLIRSKVFKRDAELFDKVGIFDTLGFQEYANESDLRVILLDCTSEGAIPLPGKISIKTPVYVLQTPIASQAMLAIIGRVKKARLQFWGYLPQEDSRLSAVRAIDQVGASTGVIVPLLPDTYQDADIHNLRAAFVAGLAFGMGKVTLMLQPSDGPAPLDVRDIVKEFRHPDDIGDSIAGFALDVTEQLQLADPLLEVPRGFLSELSLGDPTAENEFQTLGSYFVKTDQFGRASRGEVNLVVGRKGAGKTALFWELTNQKRSKVQNIVVDLKPQGYQLIRLKEDVLDFLAEGAKVHLITAFFEYVLYLEIAYKLLEKDRGRHLRDIRLYAPYEKLNELYQGSVAGEGDFSERLLSLSQRLASEFRARRGQGVEQRLTAAEVTELVHKNSIRGVREAISGYLEFKDETWVLFDNLDKGWSAQGIAHEDVLILRSLIDAARKIQREMQADRHGFHCVVFVRNDVYQLLVERSSDYGKESRAVLDWSDSDLLRELLRRRIVRNSLSPEVGFEQVWGRVCTSHYGGEETSQYFIDRSLMRPRNLLKILGHALGFAINLNHEKILDGDIEKGMRSYSLDLITEADQELTDVVGRETNLLYHFIGEGSEFSKSHIERILTGSGIIEDEVEKVIKFLIYFGFVGVRLNGNDTKFIYNVGYDTKMLSVLIAKAGEHLTYMLNPAFTPALN